MKNVSSSFIVFTALVACLSTGCLAVKTQHEVKPIHITMDVNLKVDKAVDDSIENNERKPPKYFKETRDMFNQKLIGLTNRGYWEKRADLTVEQEQIILLSNAEQTQRYAEIATKTNSSLAEIEKKHASRFVERIPVGKGVWYQDATGEWKIR
jgi:uncharacterized protein YdbL (DUF1318 family)